MVKPNCQTCGLCCCASAGQDRFCNVTEEDVKRLPPRFRLKVLHPSAFDIFANMLDHRAVDSALRTSQSKVSEGPLKGKFFTTCCALVGSVGHRVRCSIYERRPTVCKTAVKPGDKNCRYLRREYLRSPTYVRSESA